MESTSFITHPPGSTMASKPPVSSSAPLVQPPSLVSTTAPPKPASVLINNNNNKVSDTPAPVVTAPSMSQSQPVTIQKQSPNVAPNTTASVQAGIQISGVKTGTVLVGQTVTTTVPSNAGPVTSNNGISTPGNSVGSGKSAVDLPNQASIKPQNFPGVRVEGSASQSPAPAPVPAPRVASAAPSLPTNTGPATSSPSAPPPVPSKTVEKVTSPPKVFTNQSVLADKSIPTTGTPPNLQKPEDLKTSSSTMNGGPTAVMKQPPPPVTILPPTPAATPPPVHRQPPSLPQVPPATATNQPVNRPSTSITGATTNQKHQSGADPSPPSTNINDTPLKQSEVSQKPQEKPTQPLPPKQSNLDTSSVKTKTQETEQKGNQEKPITSGTSSVTISKSAVSNSPATSTPAQVVGGGGPKGNQTKPESPCATVKTSQPVPTPEKSPKGKKMDTEDVSSAKESMIPASGKTDSQPGGGDAQVLDSGISPNKSVMVGGAKIEETEKKIDNLCDATDVSAKDKQNKNVLGDKKQPDMSKSVYSQQSCNGGKKEEIGEDVRRIMEAIENAGLCGPAPSEYSNNLSGEMAKNAKNRSMSSGLKSQTRPGTGIGASPSKAKSASSPTKGRPATASNLTSGNGANGSPLAEKSSKEKAVPGSAATLPPKTATSGARTSTSRVASARANTAQNMSKTPNENKNSKAKPNGADSCNASPLDTETGNRNGSGSRSTPRLRPSSSLYRPTASSALKGVSSAPHNNGSSNQNLQSNPATPRTSRPTGARLSRSSITMGDSAGGSGDAKPTTLRDQFTAFSRFGNKEEDGKHITLSNCDKWMKQAKVIDGKKITTTDTSICFKKLFKTAKKITFEDFKKYVEELAKSKKIEPQEILDKLALCGPPGLSSATRAAHSNVVDRLTDTSKYTGSHKERFDSTGKGRGIEGRKDVPDGSGYVAAFKEKLDIKEKEIEAKEGSPSPTPAK